MNNKRSSGGIKIPDYKQSVLQSYNNKAIWYWDKNRYIDPWNLREDQEVNPNTYGHLIILKKPKMYNGQRNAYSTNDVHLTRCLHAKECKLFHIFYSVPNKVQGDKRPQYKPETLNLIKEKVESRPESTGTGNDFLNRTPIAQHLYQVLIKETT